MAASSTSGRVPAKMKDFYFAATDKGMIQGKVDTTASGKRYKKFLGVPFAAPPIGELRFCAPRPAAPWPHFRAAHEERPPPPQRGAGCEDCLYLNVFTPEHAPVPAPCPVMVYVYGGGFTHGDCAVKRCPPDSFIDRGLILVTFNYRVGAIGFLSLQNDDIPGNAGLKDQVMALQWVQRNIAAFGGDPIRVTLFGESAGGCSISHLLLSPAAKGLFSRAIMESGVATSFWGVEPAPRTKALRLARALGFDAEDDDVDDARLAAFLRAARHEDLTRDDHRALSDTERRCINRLAFVPVVEPPSDTAVVTEPPASVLKEGRHNHVPIMIGVTSADGSVLVDASKLMESPEMEADLKENFSLLVGSQLLLPTDEERRRAAVEVERFYFGDAGFTLANPQAVYDMVSDMFFIQSTVEFARVAALTNKRPVYFYFFDYDGYGSLEYGMQHAAEATYLFSRETSSENNEWNAEDYEVKEKLLKLWTSFAVCGKPAPSDMPVVWKRFAPDSWNYLHMKKSFVMQQEPLKERMDFWRRILPF